MFNSFAFEKKLEEYKKSEHDRRKQKVHEKKHKQDMEQLVKSYNNRVQKFMVDMFETPLVVPQYKEKEYQFRDYSNKGLLGRPKFVTQGWRTERQRIEENIAKNMETTWHEAVDHKKAYNILTR